MRPVPRTKRICWTLVAALFAVFASVEAASAQGMISGVVFDVETSEGEPANRVPIALVGTSGTSTVGTTGPNGSATVPYTSTHPTGTRIQVVAVTVSGGMQIALVPDGQTSQECEEAKQQNEDNCQELGVLTWGRTPSVSYRLGGTFTQYVQTGTSGGGQTATSGEHTLYTGLTFGRSRELSSFTYGVRLAGTFSDGPRGGRLAWVGNLSRASLNSDISVTMIELMGGVQVPVGPPVRGLDLYAFGGVVFDRQSSDLDFGSGSDTGFGVRAGLGKRVGDDFKVGGFLGATSRRNATDFEFGIAIVRQW